MHLCEFRMAFFPGRQIGLLVVSAHGDLGGLVLVLPVIDQAVVDEAARFKHPVQLTGLCLRGIEPDL